MDKQTEEILFINSSKKDVILLNKNSLAEENCLYTPHSLAIKIPSKNPQQTNAHHRQSRALVIGEMPFELNDSDSNSNAKQNSHVKNKKWSIRESSDFSLNFIDSPEASAPPVIYNKASLIPYLILPINNYSNSNQLNDQVEIEEASSSLVNKRQRDEDGKNDEQEKDEEKSEPDKSNETTPIEREHWDHKIEFLLAIIGFSVDLGNIWRFPKVVYDNGGGRFLIPYFVQLALCGLPLFYMELALGQFHQTGLFTLWEKICPILKGLAFTAVIIDLFMAMFYNTVIAWAIYYLISSFRREVPWKGCKNEWNTLCCFPINENLKLPLVKNYSLNSNFYQKKSKHDMIYEVFNINKSSIRNRIVMFDTQIKSQIKSQNDSNMYFYQKISNFFKDVLPTVETLSYTPWENSNNNISASSKNPSSLEYRLEEWINSIFILDNSQRKLNRAVMPHLNENELARFIYDPVLLVQLIEDNLVYLYPNKTVDVILNCGKFLNNPTQEFYTRHLTEMHRSTGLEDLGGLKVSMIFCLFIVFVTVYFALWKGIKSAGKAVWITAIAPYIVLFILLIRGLTLEGSSQGISFYLTIKDWGSLLEMKVWVDAATQIFFSLGPGFGTIIALSSYNKRSNNCYKDALLTSFINCLTSILSGFVVFSTLGHMAHVQGKTIDQVTEPGPGLIFVTYPQAISMMPGAPIWAIIFFFMLFTLGIDSTFGGLESVITGICDTFPHTIGKKRSWFVLALICACFLAALPTCTYGGAYIVHLFDNYAVAPSILIVVFLEVMGVMYGYDYLYLKKGCDRFCDDIYQMLHNKPSKFWVICWKFISPSIVVAITVMICSGMVQNPLEFGNGYIYLGVGEVLAGLIVGVPISFILLYVCYRMFCTKGSFKERIKKLITPSEPWIKSKSQQSFDADNLNEQSKRILTESQFQFSQIEKSNNARYIIVNLNNSQKI